MYCIMYWYVLLHIHACMCPNYQTLIDFTLEVYIQPDIPTCKTFPLAKIFPLASCKTSPAKEIAFESVIPPQRKKSQYECSMLSKVAFKHRYIRLALLGKAQLLLSRNAVQQKKSIRSNTLQCGLLWSVLKLIQEYNDQEILPPQQLWPILCQFISPLTIGLLNPSTE